MILFRVYGWCLSSRSTLYVNFNNWFIARRASVFLCLDLRGSICNTMYVTVPLLSNCEADCIASDSYPSTLIRSKRIHWGFTNESTENLGNWWMLVKVRFFVEGFQISIEEMYFGVSDGYKGNAATRWFHDLAIFSKIPSSGTPISTIKHSDCNRLMVLKRIIQKRELNP